MSSLKEKLAAQGPQLWQRVRKLAKEHGSKVISEVTVEQVLGGMRGVKSLVCDTSEVLLDQGVIIRGIPILELTNRLPEEIFYLLLTGELPDENSLNDLQSELRKRSEVPNYIWAILKAFPADAIAVDSHAETRQGLMPFLSRARALRTGRVISARCIGAGRDAPLAQNVAGGF